MREDDRQSVASLELLPEQTAYVRPLAQILADLQAHHEPHVITWRHRVLGFFLIDTRCAAAYAFCRPGELGLLGYCIDARRQGEGHGRAAVNGLRSYLSTIYPTAPAVVLTVNCRNTAAIRSYLGGGFNDTGELYHGGRAGPQHIFRMPLRSES